MHLYDLEQRVFDRQREKAVRTAVGKLSLRQRVVIAARFGLDDGRPQTLDQAAATLGKIEGHTLGRERIRQIECRALLYLKVRGGLYDVAGVKNPAKVFDPVAFRRHQQGLQAEREAQQRWEEERQALRQAAAEQWQAQQAAKARQAAEAYAAEARARRQRFADQAAARWSPWSNPPPAPRPAAVPVQMLPNTPSAPPSNHYDWMQRSRDDLDRWRAGGRPVNPFDWMKS